MAVRVGLRLGVPGRVMARVIRAARRRLRGHSALVQSGLNRRGRINHLM